MTVYLVIEDADSDAAQNIGVFSTREKAEVFVAACASRHHPLEIEEWAVDEKVGYVSRTAYLCRVHLSGGQPFNRWTFEEIADPNASVDMVTRECPPAHGMVYAQTYVSADRALEMATEERQKWLREIGEATE